MKKAWVFFFAVVIGLSFAVTGFAQENATSGPAQPGKQLAKGRFVKTMKPKQTGGTSTAQQSTQAATTAKHAVSSSSTTSAASTRVVNGTVGPGSDAGKKLTKGKYTRQGREK